jgi:hypothetical protein
VGITNIVLYDYEEGQTVLDLEDLIVDDCQDQVVLRIVFNLFD